MSSSSNVHATPTRDRHPFPQSLHPSPNNQRTPAVSVTGTSPSSVPAVVPNQPATLDALLAAHASASSPPLAALEATISERNLLSAQNAQLWKLIEKQRSGYNQILKELERVRTERDGYKVKLQQAAAGQSAVASGSGGRKERERSKQSSISGISTSGGPAASESGTSSIASSVSDHAPTNPRHTITRHYSDDQPTPRGTHHTIHASRSQEPMYSRDRERSSFRNNSNSSTSSLGPPPASAPSQLHHNTQSSSSSTNNQKLPRLVVPLRADSLPLPSFESAPQEPGRRHTEADAMPSSSLVPKEGIEMPAPLPSLASTRPLTVARKTTSDSGTGVTISVQQSPVVATPQTAPAGLSGIPVPMTSASSIPPSQGYLLSSISTSPSQLAPVVEDQYRNLSRESRISLPDEAKQYIANMGESPIPSPKVNQFAGQSSGSHPATKFGTPTHVDAPGPLEPYQQYQRPPNGNWHSANNGVSIAPSASTQGGDTYAQPRPSHSSGQSSTSLRQGAIPPAADSGRDWQPKGKLVEPHPDSEFLDMGDETDTANEEEDDEGEEVEEAPATQVSQHRDQSGAQQAALARGKTKPRAAVEDFPLPPSSPLPLMQTQAQMQMTAIAQAQALQLQAQAQSSTQEYIPTRSPPQPPSEHQEVYDSTSVPPSIYPPLAQIIGSEQDMTQYSQTPQSLPASFRALPLLASDMPHTQIQVSHSSIRPNDRGKDVLSFIVVVDPGQGKETWRVEKLYSDVLGLDSRIRAGVGKGVGKKIASLPEGKLWKDHAPAKVDQRKVCGDPAEPLLITGGPL
jgi:RalA-binding protein 1